MSFRLYGTTVGANKRLLPVVETYHVGNIVTVKPDHTLSVMEFMERESPANIACFNHSVEYLIR